MNRKLFGLAALAVMLMVPAGCASAKSKLEARYAEGLCPFTVTGLEKAQLTRVWEQTLTSEEQKRKTEVQAVYIYDDLMLVADSENFVYAFNRYTGDGAWVTQLPLPLAFKPTLFQDTFYGLCGDRVVTIDEKGVLEIDGRLSISVSAPFIVAPQYYYMAGSDSALHKINSADLSSVWNVPARTAGPIVIALVEIPPYCVLGNTTGQVIAIDEITGGRRLNFKARANITGLATDGEVVYAGSSDFYLYCLTVNNIRKWSYLAEGPVDGAPVLSGDVVYITALGAGVQAVDRIKGDRIWVNDAAKAFLSAGGGNVFTTGPQEELWLLDAKDGKEKSRLDISGFSLVVTNINNDGLVYLVSREGRIICLRAL